MASSNGKKNSTVQSTRQQLDELDALLQKMLTLPVAPSEAAEEEPEPQPAPVVSGPAPTPAVENPLLPRRVSLRPVPQSEQPTPPPVSSPVETPLSPRLVPAEAAPEEPAEEWVPLRGNWQPSAQTWGPLAEMFRQQQTGHEAEPTVTTGSVPDEPGVIRESVLMPLPSADSGEPAYLSFLPPPAAPAPLTAPVPPPMPPPPLPEPPPEVPLSSVEAMAQLNRARQTPPPVPPVRQPPPVPVPLSTSLFPEEPPAHSAAPAPSGRGKGSLVLFPLVALNAVYDVATYPLGPLGRWLREGGRGVLGMLGGVFFVATTAMLALDWFDWTW